MQAQGWLRILAERGAGQKEDILTSQRLSGKFLMIAMTQGGPLQSFQFFPWQLQKELKNIDLFGGFAGPQRYVGK